VLEYTLNHGDLDAFFAHHADHAPYIRARNRRMRWLWVGLFGLFAILLYESSKTMSLACGALAVAYLLFYVPLNRWWYVRHNHRLNAGQESLATGRVRLSLQGSQLLVDGESASSTFQLSALQRIESSATHYFLYTGPAMALIIPKVGGEAEALVRSIRDAKAAT